MVSLLGTSYVVDGVCLPHYPGMEENMQRVREFVPIDTDLILCSYPKSGSHWVNEIMRMLFTNSLEYSSSPLNNLESGYINSDKSDTPRIIHSHLPYSMLPESVRQRKIVYVLRHPKDQMVSLYYHYQGFKWAKSTRFEEFFGQMLYRPDQEYGNWFQNAYQWWLEAQQRDNILLLYYEDMKLDLEAHIHKIAEFYELSVPAEFISQVTQRTQFQQMKANKPVGDWFRDWHKDSFSICRKGVAGSWKKHFTNEMNFQFSQLCQRYLDCDSKRVPYSGLMWPLSIEPPLLPDLMPVMSTVSTSDELSTHCILEKAY